MKVTVFTSNQPRHIALIESFSEIADEVYAVQECNTIFPGQVEDFFKKTEVMQKYFKNVIAAEEKVFGRPRFFKNNVRTLSIKTGDLNKLELKVLEPALQSDYFVIFGASFIKSPLCDILVEKKAYNIHMGTSPYYRGNSCNFWCLYDNRPEYVGATIHILTRGLDSGPMLFHAFPKAEEVDGFLLGMKAVKSAQNALVDRIKTGEINKLEPIKQNKELELRYTKNIHFDDQVAEEYLKRTISPKEIHQALLERDYSKFLNSYIDS